VAAVLLLFPVSEGYMAYRRESAASETPADILDSVFFMKQTIGNACGTIGIIHAIANNVDRIELGLQSF
jgi:ubiquitin carboxyl-terminal hydrolase L3